MKRRDFLKSCGLATVGLVIGPCSKVAMTGPMDKAGYKSLSSGYTYDNGVAINAGTIAGDCEVFDEDKLLEIMDEMDEGKEKPCCDSPGKEHCEQCQEVGNEAIELMERMVRALRNPPIEVVRNGVLLHVEQFRGRCFLLSPQSMKILHDVSEEVLSSPLGPERYVHCDLPSGYSVTLMLYRDGVHDIEIGDQTDGFDAGYVYVRGVPPASWTDVLYHAAACMDSSGQRHLVEGINVELCDVKDHEYVYREYRYGRKGKIIEHLRGIDGVCYYDLSLLEYADRKDSPRCV